MGSEMRGNASTGNTTAPADVDPEDTEQYLIILIILAHHHHHPPSIRVGMFGSKKSVCKSSARLLGGCCGCFKPLGWNRDIARLPVPVPSAQRRESQSAFWWDHQKKQTRVGRNRHLVPVPIELIDVGGHVYFPSLPAPAGLVPCRWYNFVDN